MRRELLVAIISVTDIYDACTQIINQRLCKRVSATEGECRGERSLVFILMYPFDKPLKTAKIDHEPSALEGLSVASTNEQM